MKMISSLKLYTCIYLRRNHQCKQNNSEAGDLIFLLLSILLKVAHFNALIEISVYFSGMFYIFIILYAFISKIPLGNVSRSTPNTDERKK